MALRGAAQATHESPSALRLKRQAFQDNLPIGAAGGREPSGGSGSGGSGGAGGVGGSDDDKNVGKLGPPPP